MNAHNICLQGKSPRYRCLMGPIAGLDWRQNLVPTGKRTTPSWSSCLQTSHNSVTLSRLQGTRFLYFMQINTECMKLKVQAKFSLWLITRHGKRTYERIGGIVPHFLNSGFRWMRKVSFTLGALYFHGNCPQIAKDKKLGVCQRRSSWFKRNICAPHRNRTLIVRARNLVTIPTDIN